MEEKGLYYFIFFFICFSMLPSNENALSIKFKNTFSLLMRKGAKHLIAVFELYN